MATISLPAGEDLTGYFGCGVRITSGTVLKAAAEGDAVGVLGSEGGITELVSVHMPGSECKIVLGEAVTTSQIGIGLKCESDGAFELWDANGDNFCAIPLQSGALGATIDGVFVCPAPSGTVHT